MRRQIFLPILLPIALAVFSPKVSAVPLITNGSFETHAAFTSGTFSYLSGTHNSWNFAAGAGIASVGGFGEMFNRDGTTWALMQGAGALVSQTFTAPAGALVSYSFVGQGRNNNGGNGRFDARIDGVLVYSTISATATAFTAAGTIFGNLSGVATLNGSPTHTIAFSWTPNVGDNTAFFDNVQLDSIAVPEIAVGAGMLPLFFVVGMLASSRRRSLATAGNYCKPSSCSGEESASPRILSPSNGTSPGKSQ